MKGENGGGGLPSASNQPSKMAVTPTQSASVQQKNATMPIKGSVVANNTAVIQNRGQSSLPWLTP